jgi:PUB domain
MHKFSLIPSKANDPYLIGVDDTIMPHPASTHFFQPLHGITWTLTHMSRTLAPDETSIVTLQRFLSNIINHPEIVKYRQLRIASRHVKPIWESPIRGLLLAVGFVEVYGYAELGCHDLPLSPSRVQEVALLIHLLREWVHKDNSFLTHQPQGALDGFGRHGFGRAGAIN